jgi:hypothetical protein
VDATTAAALGGGAAAGEEFGSWFTRLIKVSQRQQQLLRVGMLDELEVRGDRCVRCWEGRKGSKRF